MRLLVVGLGVRLWLLPIPRRGWLLRLRLADQQHRLGRGIMRPREPRPLLPLLAVAVVVVVVRPLLPLLLLRAVLLLLLLWPAHHRPARHHARGLHHTLRQPHHHHAYLRPTPHRVGRGFQALPQGSGAPRGGVGVLSPIWLLLLLPPRLPRLLQGVIVLPGLPLRSTILLLRRLRLQLLLGVCALWELLLLEELRLLLLLMRATIVCPSPLLLLLLLLLLLQTILCLRLRLLLPAHLLPLLPLPLRLPPLSRLLRCGLCA